jgi:hypothetical protein
MTTEHDDESEPEPALAEATQRQAEVFVKKIATVAIACGFDFVVVSVSRRIDLDDGRAMAPGATALEASPSRMGPALPNEAEALRKIADHLDKLGAPYRDIATHGYTQDKSDYASGGREWPR